MGDMGDVFKAMRADSRARSDEALDRAAEELPRSSGRVVFRWVNEGHVHAVIGRRVVAQWWPSHGKTMVGTSRGRRCATATEFVALVKEKTDG